MSTPMSNALDFLVRMEARIVELRKDHWDWFDFPNRVSPEDHYRSLDDRILSLEFSLRTYCDRIRAERAKGRGVSV